MLSGEPSGWRLYDGEGVNYGNVKTSPSNVAVNRIVSEKGYEIYNSTKVSRPWAGQVAKATTCSPQGSKVKTDHTVHISE